jgi:ferrous iron transport protein A
MSPDEFTLDQINPGAFITVVRVDGDDVVARRLDDLGFWAGTTVEVVRRAPFGDPTQYAFRGYRLALRRAEARRVIVRMAAQSADRQEVA